MKSGHTALRVESSIAVFAQGLAARVWHFFCSFAAGLDADSGEPLTALIERREHLRRLTSERKRTERKMWSTPQTHRRNELYAQLQQLNKQIDELQ